MSNRYGRGRVSLSRDSRHHDDRSRDSRHQDDRSRERYGMSRNDRPPSRRGGGRGRSRDETPPRRRRGGGGSTAVISAPQYNGVTRYEDQTQVINQIIRRLDRDDRRDRHRVNTQLQQFASLPQNKEILEEKCEELLKLLDPIIDDAVRREQDYGLPQTIASIGIGLGPRCRDVINWLTNRLSSNKSPEVIGFLLNITKHLADTKGSLSTGVLPLIDTLIQLLERIVQPQMIIIFLDALVPLTQCYPAFFTPHFNNIVDVLIGWHIECDNNTQLQKSIGNAFVKFKQFWLSDVTYPLTLIMQFVGDAEREQHDICTSNTTVDFNAMKRYTSLIKVFMTVIAAISDNISSNYNIPDFLCKHVCRVIESSNALLSYHQSYELVNLIASSTSIILKCAPSHFGMIGSTMLHFLMQYITPVENFDNNNNNTAPPHSSILSCLQAILHITEHGSSWMTRSTMDMLTQPDSPLIIYRTSTHEQVLSTIYRIFGSLLQLHNIKLLDVMYQFIIKDLHLAIETLLKAVKDESITTEAVEQSESFACIDLALLTEMAACKTHGFNMWSLNPNIFELVTVVHSPHNWMLSLHYPRVHYSLLNVLHSECKRHGYFLPGAGTSELMSPHPVNTNSHLCKVLSLLSLLLPHPTLEYDSRYFCLLWVKRVVEIMKKAGESSNSMKFCQRELQELALALVKIADDTERDIRLEVAGCLRLLLLGQLLTSETQIHCLAVSIMHMGDVDGATRGAFVGVIEAISPDILLRYEVDTLDMDKYTLRPSLQARHNLVCTSEVTQVSGNQFSILMRLILLNQIPGRFIHDDWLERLFYASNINPSKTPFISDGKSPCDSALWYWFMWQSALFCTNNKLKTPLGKATETFECLEAILIDIIDGEVDTEQVNLYARGIISGIGSHCYVSLLRSNLLLHFINNLEKLVYNSYQGTVHAIQPCSKPIRNFFVINQTTCEEWFCRIRSVIAQVCYNTGMYAECWRHSTLSNSSSLLPIMAALKLRSAGHIRGLASQYKDSAGLLKAVEYQCKGRYEAAVKLYKSYTTDKEDEKDFIVKQTLECYLALADWEETLEWCEEHSSYLFNEKSTYDKNYIYALHAFDKGNWTKVAQHLDKIPGGNITAVADEVSRKGGLRIANLSLEVDIPIQADPESLLYLSQLQLLRVCGLYHIAGDIQLVGTEVRSDVDSFSEDGERADTAVEKGPEFIFRKLLRQASSLVEVGVRISGIDLPVNLPGRHAVQLQCVSALHQLLLCDTVKAPTGVPLNLSGVELKLDENIHDIGNWMSLYRYAHHLYQYFEPCNDNSKNMLSSQMILSLGVSCARLARKQDNTRLAQRLLINELSWHHSAGVQPPRPPLSQPITYISDNNCNLIGSNPETTPQNVSTLSASLFTSLQGYMPIDLLPLHKESAKLLYHCGSHSEAVEALSATLLYNSNLSKNGRVVDNRESVKCALTLAKWISRDTTLGLMALSPTFCSMQTLLDVEAKKCYNSDIRIEDSVKMSEVEFLEGRLLRYVCQEAKDMADSWYALAEWSYRVGKKSLDQLNLSRGEAMLPEEKYRIEEILKGTDHAEKVLSILLGSVMSFNKDTLEKRLADVDTKITPSQIAELMHVYDVMAGKLYNNYRISLSGYCRYLHLTPGLTSSSSSSTSSPSSASSSNLSRDLATHKLSKGRHKELSACLRLLKLITTYSYPLNDMLKFVSTAPPAHWSAIIPQLLSRIGHSDPAVRAALLHILCNVALHYPHILVYNCVERCYSKTNEENNEQDDIAKMIGKMDLGDEEEEEDNSNNQDEDDLGGSDENEAGVGDGKESKKDADNEKNTERSSSSSTLIYQGYQTIYETLLEHNKNMVSDVQLIVQELRRINLLWTELWAGLLGHRNTDIHRKLCQLTSEIKRVNANPNLKHEEKVNITRAKQQALLKPVTVLLERVISITNKRVGETKNEVEFQEKFGKKIMVAMDYLNNHVDLKNPVKCWSKFEELHEEVQEHIKSNLLHHLSEISPRLSKLNQLCTPLPGTGGDWRSPGYVTIESFHEDVHVLPTKTKPKKIGILGSDGRRYTYLFKGLEDLRLDERIMQLLRVCNTIFTSSGHANYSVRSYSVTPLGPRSGLIQWVGSASPLFSLYKRWQQREALKKNPDSPLPIFNCSDLFRAKIKTAMPKWNVSESTPRAQWPVEMLLEVLKQLTNETPSDLLSKELWCNSTSPIHWWDMIQKFTFSSAAMSIIGYIIGLGDRHLDNILVDFQQGDVVHIDYNVCFEKGRGLRVPEKVPCRLTTNIQNAFGPGGVDGSFRTACEDVVKILRGNKEIVLSLLEAFVFDPLIQWTGAQDEGAFVDAVKDADDGGITRKELEIDSLYSLLSCRITELNVPLRNNKTAFTAAITSLSKSVKALGDCLSKFNPLDTEKQNILTRQKLLQEIKDDQEHNLWQLQERFEAQAAHNAHHATLSARVVTETERYQGEQQKFNAILEFIEGNILDTLISELSKTNDGDNEPSYVSAFDFLTMSGQTDLVTLAEQAESKIKEELLSRRQATITALKALKPYGSIVSFFQNSFVNQHKCSFWAKWLGKVVVQPSATECDEVCAQCELSSAQYHYLLKPVAIQIEEVIQENTKTLKIKLKQAADTLEQLPSKAELSTVEKCIKAQDARYISFSAGCTLVNICKQIYSMEYTVQQADNQLGTLNTVTGQWFMEEFLSTSRLVGSVLQLLPDTDNNTTCITVQSAVQQYIKFMEDLMDIYSTYCTIVLQETLKTLLCGNQEVINVIYEYMQVLETALHDGLSDDASEAYAAVRGNSNNDITLKTEEINLCIKSIQERVSAEYHTQDQSRPNYKGCLLVMCLESLLSKTLDSMLVTMDAMRAVLPVVDEHLPKNTQEVLRSIDINRWDNNTIHGLLYVTLIKAILSYLKSCCLHVQLFDRTSEMVTSASRGTAPPIMWSNSDTLLLPIKQFLGVVLQTGGIGYLYPCIAFIVSQTLASNFNVEPSSLTTMFEKVEVLLKGEADAVKESQEKLSEWDRAWKTQNSAGRINSEIKMIKSCMQRSQLELIAFQWLHEKSELAGAPRQAFVADLSHKLNTLLEVSGRVKEATEQRMSIEAKIRQRLNWAAGANPSTRKILELFDARITANQVFTEKEEKYTSDVVDMCTSVISLENQRQYTEQYVIEETSLITLLRKFAESTALVEEYSRELEESAHIIKILAAPMNGGMNKEWVEKELDKCKSQITEFQNLQKTAQAEVKSASEDLLKIIERTKEHAAGFVKVIGEVAEQLHILAREEVTSNGARLLLKSNQKLVADLKAFLTHAKEFAYKCKKEQVDMIMLDSWIQKTPQHVADINNMKLLLEWIFAQLDKYSKGITEIAVPPINLVATTPQRNRTRIHTTSEKNHYAVTVLKRVQNKLDGREGNVFLSPTDQVSSIISAATSAYNLALMYEGWTPWV